MSALVWKQAAKVWWGAFQDCSALLAMVRAELDAADTRVSEAHDERDVAIAAHYELAREYDAQRDQLRAVQSELAQRASRTLDADRSARDEADARWKAARDRLTAAEREVELARWDEDDARIAAADAHRAVVSGRGEVAA